MAVFQGPPPTGPWDSNVTVIRAQWLDRQGGRELWGPRVSHLGGGGGGEIWKAEEALGRWLLEVGQVTQGKRPRQGEGTAAHTLLLSRKETRRGPCVWGGCCGGTEAGRGGPGKAQP